MTHVYSYWPFILSGARTGLPAYADTIARAIFAWSMKELRHQSSHETDEAAVDFTSHIIRDDFSHLPDADGAELMRFLRISLKNFMIDRWRARKRLDSHEIYLSQMEDTDSERFQIRNLVGGDSIQILLRKEEVAELGRAVSELSNGNQALIHFCCLGYSQSEMASLLGMRENTLNQRFFSIRKQIKARLKRDEQKTS